MYLLDDLGRIQWKIRLQEPPLGDVHVTDRYRNGKYQLVLNTCHQLFMLDMNGANAPGFPVTLKYPATNGLSVFDYENRKDYRILLACDDHKLYNFTSDGKPTKGWLYPSAEELISSPVVYLKMLGKDYLIAACADGTCCFYDRKGKAYFPKSRIGFIKAASSGFFIFPDGNRSRIITTDRKGRIIRVAPDGSWDAITLRTFGPGHKFFYDDFDGNGIKDYIFLDSNLYVFNVNKKLICKLKLSDPADAAPVRVNTSRKIPLFGTVSERSGKIYLFSKNGFSPLNAYLEGSTPFCTGAMDNSGITSLIVAKDKTVYNYYLIDY